MESCYATDDGLQGFHGSTIAIASFPGSPPCAHEYCMTFDPHEESQGEPGEFYHMSDVKGREDCT